MTSPPFELAVIEAIARAVGDACTGREITVLLRQAGAGSHDPGEVHTKWRRIDVALAQRQAERRNGNVVVNLVTAAATPARWASKPGGFDELVRALSVPLAFAGLQVNDEGKVVRAKLATTLSDVAHLTQRMRSELERRHGHPEVFKYCTRELLAEDCFGAVFEAVKGLGDRIRLMAGLDLDGSALVSKALEGSAPILVLNGWTSTTEKSEQTGLASVMKGVFSAFRNPAAHEPRVRWPVSTDDAIDLLTTLSLLHRRLDGAKRRVQS